MPHSDPSLPTSQRSDKGWIEIAFSMPSTPYVIGVILWVLSWWAQMGPLRPFLNFAPGVELPFFPAGVRTLAVFIFGIHGAIGIFIGSLITYSLYFPELLSASPGGIIGCAAASAFSSYFAMRIVCTLCKIPNTLEGLNLRNTTWIVITQGLISASVHQLIYHWEVIQPANDPLDTKTNLINWAAMVSGDTTGSMLVLLGILVANDLYQRRHKQRKTIL